MKKIFVLLILVLVGLLSLTLALKNGHDVTMSYYFDIQYTASLAKLLIIAFAAGLLSGLLVMSLSLFKSRYVANKANKKLNKAEKEVEGLKALPKIN